MIRRVIAGALRRVRARAFPGTPAPEPSPAPEPPRAPLTPSEIAERLGRASARGAGALDAEVVAVAPELFAMHRQEARVMAGALSARARAEGRPLRWCPSCGDVPEADPSLVAPGADPACPACGLPTTAGP